MMRFLCFHGMGTNAKFFEHQTAKLREALGPRCEFVFVDAPFPAEPAAGTGVSADTARRWSSDNPADYQKVYNDVLELIARRGPFDGVMGFSEGGAVAAGALIADAQMRFADFRGGIFFSSSTPQDLNAALKTGTLRDLDPATDGVVIDVPTAHVWSDRDRVGKDMGRDLVGLCRADLRSEFVHSVGHDVPGARASDEGFAGALLAMERTVERMRRGRGPRV